MPKVQQHFEYLFDDAANVVFWEFLTGDNLFEQFTPFTQFQYENIMGFVIIDLVKSDNIDMIQ